MRILARGVYTISASELSGVFDFSPVYLEDLYNGEAQNLSIYPEYRFEADEGDLKDQKCISGNIESY